MTRWRLAAAVWAAVVLALTATLGVQLWRGPKFETGLLALLPSDEQHPLVSEAVNRVAESGSRHAVFLVGHSDPKVAMRAADACAKALQGKAGIAHAISQVDADVAGEAQAFYRPHRYHLLSPGQRARLTHASDDALLSSATDSLYHPLGPPRLLPLESDPFNVFSESLLEIASRSAFRTLGKNLIVPDGTITWAVVLVELSETSASISHQKTLLADFNAAEQAARHEGAEDVLRAGFFFHAAQAATQAEWEMSVIGTGSLLGVVVLMLGVFRSFKPLLLVLLPIAVGCVVALSVSQLVFSRLHLITLVFGTSIIGVAVDYGILFVSGRLARGNWDPNRRRLQILPSVSMAIGTSLLAYASLAIMPFPLLRQMGVFSMLGLSTAWLTAVLWLPLLSKNLPNLSSGPMPAMLRWAHAHWPRIENSWLLRGALALCVVGTAVGIGRLHSNDDVRGLYAQNAELVRQQDQIERLLKLPSAGQFFLATADNEQGVLERNEAVAAGLERLQGEGKLNGFSSVSTYLPSFSQQEADRALQTRRLYQPGALATKLFAALESPEVAQVAAKQAAAGSEFLKPAEWLASNISTPFRSLWLGKTSHGWAALTTVSGLQAGAEGRLEEIAATHRGVEFVDHVQSVSRLLQKLRLQISALMVVGYAVVLGLLFLRYRRASWRAAVPALLACAATAGFFGWAGLPCNLLCVFGLLLSLDMGVDYGIYMQEEGAGDFGIRLVSASVAAIATLLSFGLLALSQTPALQSFGLCVLLAISGSWLLAPCFSKLHREANG